MTPNQRSLTTSISKDSDDDNGPPAITLKLIPSPPIPLSSISCIGIGDNHPCKVIWYTETTMDKVEDLKSSAICRHGAGNEHLATTKTKTNRTVTIMRGLGRV